MFFVPTAKILNFLIKYALVVFKMEVRIDCKFGKVVAVGRKFVVLEQN